MACLIRHVEKKETAEKLERLPNSFGVHRAPTRAYEQKIALKADGESFTDLDELVSPIGDRSTCPQSFSQHKTTTLHKARLRYTLILVYGTLCGPHQKAYFMRTHLWLKSI